MLDRLPEMVQKLCVDRDAELLKINGESDYVHVHLGLNPKCAPSVVANNFKTATSWLLRKEFPPSGAPIGWCFWSRSYFLATVGGSPLSVIKHCIEQQERRL
jgi:putative transposase